MPAARSAATRFLLDRPHPLHNDGKQVALDRSEGTVPGFRLGWNAYAVLFNIRKEKIRATKGDSMTRRFWSCALVTFLSAGVSAGFSLAGLLGPGRDDSFARYAASRSVALLLAVLIAIGIRSRMAIAFLGIAMTVVQAFDGVIGALAHDPSKTYGPFALAVINAVTVGWLLREQESHPNEPVKS